MRLNNLVADIMNTSRAEIQGAGLRNRPELTSVVISHEDLDSASKEVGASALQSLHATIDDTINMVLSKEEYEGTKFTKAQYAAAKMIAGYAMDPIKTMSTMQSKQPTISVGTVVMSSEAMGADDVVLANTLSTEMFDSQAVNNAIYYSIAYNFAAARQDNFAEGFFPTIVYDPAQSGVVIETEFATLVSEFERSITGTPDGKKFNKVPLIKAIYDNTLFGTDKNKLVPVYRPENIDMFVSTQQLVDKSTGSDILTAPLKLGKTISLLGISQTDAMLAKGTMDNTDALDRTINLDKIFFSITGKNAADETITDVFGYKVSVLPHSNFTYAPQDNHKDMTLTFRTESISINTSSTTTAKGATSGILATLPVNHLIMLSIKLHGEANTASSDVSVYGSVIEVIEVRDAAGETIPVTSAEYLTIKAAIADLKLEGYTLEAYRTNSNLRTRGQLITNDRHSQLYNVQLRSGITVLMPTNNATGTDGDASKLSSMIQAAGVKTSIYAVRTLLDHAEMLHNITNNGTTPSVELMGIGRHNLNTYYNETTIDLADHVDSVRSNDRITDIRAALVNKIRDEVLNMYLSSNYVTAYEAMRGNMGGKVTVIIGTDPKLKQYITGGSDKIDLGDDFEAVVVSTPNSLIKNKIFISFSVFDEQRNTTPNPLNFGQCAWFPTITTDIVRTNGGSVVRELQTNPRFLHIVNMPILAVMNVSDTNEVLGRHGVKFVN